MTGTGSFRAANALTPRGPLQIHLRSSIPAEFLHEAEKLFYFNPKQSLVRNRVRQHVERYGSPTIRCHDRVLSFDLSRVDHAQTFFIMLEDVKPRLIGMLIYVREGESIKVLYLALIPPFTNSWRKSCSVILTVLDLLRKLVRPIKGVTRIELALDDRDLTLRI